MKLNSLRKLYFTLAVCSVFFFAFSVSAQDKDWRPVSPEELASKTSVVETNADAEAIFWEVRVDDSSSDLSLKHYVRVKIFTERGRDDFSKKDIPYLKGTKVKDVEARVTKPDGSTVFLKKEDVLEREIVKANGFKVKAKSFALPGLEVGSIVEYRYREMIENAEANMRLVFQREVPIQTISYFVKPFSGYREMRYVQFNTGETKFEKDKDGFSRATMKNVPAFREEPDMLPEDEVKSWMYIYYAAPGVKNAADYWKDISKFMYEASKSTYKANDEVKAATAQAIAEATTDEEKLRKIYEFTKSQIRNVSYSATTVSDEDWKKVRASKSAGDVLKLKMGSGSDVDMLFGAMARAAGFDARIALSGSRNEMSFNPQIANVSLMLNSSSVAVKIGEDWRFFSPASYFTPFGMLSWPEEKQTALITDPKEPIWKEIPLSPAEKSLDKRTGRFKLLDDGSLEGEATLEFTGHSAYYYKNLNRGDSTTEQEKTLKDLIHRYISGIAEVQSFSIENVYDPDKPFVYKFKIRVPDYATRTGKRIFFQPNVFEKLSKPHFVSSSRKYDIYFSYPWSERDEIQIELPAGFQLENADAPAPMRDKQGIADHKTEMGISKDGKILVYKRIFSFGNGGFIKFPADGYPVIKAYFDAFNKADTHQLTVRQAVVAAAAVPPPAKMN